MKPPDSDVTLYKHAGQIKAAFDCIYNQYIGQDKHFFSFEQGSRPIGLTRLRVWSLVGWLLGLR